MDLRTYLAERQESERQEFQTAFGWGWRKLSDIRPGDPADPSALYYVAAVAALESHPKLAIWLALLCFLREIHVASFHESTSFSGVPEDDLPISAVRADC